MNEPGFVKLGVPDLAAAKRFYAEVFGWQEGASHDLPEFCQTTMTAPGSAFGVILRYWKDAPQRDIGNGWGPLGVRTGDLEATLARAVAHGATITKPVTEAGATRFVILRTPYGHEIELVQPAG